MYKAATQPKLKLSGGLMLAIAAMYMGNLTEWKRVIGERTRLRVPDGLRMERELAVAALKAWMHSRRGYPKWLDTGAFSGLAPELFALEHIEAAAALAMPLGFTQPFIEYRHTLTGVMDEFFEARYPEQLATIRKQSQPFMRNWTKVYNGYWEHQMSDGLTQREFEVCALYSRGMQAGEIALRMGISINSVRKYLGAAFGKLGVEERRKLNELIHP